MSYRIEKETGDIVIDGFEQGIAPSPHRGMASLRGANISTELGEATCSFPRVRQIPAVAASGGVLTASGGDGNYVLASNAALTLGAWIEITSTDIQTTSPRQGASLDFLVVGGGGAGGRSASNIAGAGGGGGGGVVYRTSQAIAVGSYPVVVGNGGATTAADNTVGASGQDSSFNGAVAKGGGGGGHAGATGAAGGSGGGGGPSGVAGGAGTANQGNPGGKNNAASAGAGGGGAGAAGSDANPNNGGKGGDGISISITGSAAYYGGGGGGGAHSSYGTAAAGGQGGGGAGGTGTAGTAGTANRGGGGGGGGTANPGVYDGGAGGSGVVIVAYPTGSLVATGGSVTTSGGNTIHTFNSSGTFAVASVRLATGYYFVDYSAAGKAKISESYDPSGANPLYHGTSGTATFVPAGALGKPIAKAVETYYSSGSRRHRYYILDDAGLVWVNDAGNSLGWLLTRPGTDYYGSQEAPSGLAVLDGWVLVFAGTTFYAKPTVDLGRAWRAVLNSNIFNSPDSPHPAFVGHQGRCYYGDGSYLGSVFPDTSLLTGTANIQSYCSYAAPDTSKIAVTPISGSLPRAGIGFTRIPVVFFTDSWGTLPSAITAGAVYWIGGIESDGSAIVFSYADPSGSDQRTVALTGGLAGGATSATLDSAWDGQTSLQTVFFTNNDIRVVQFTNNSTSITWSTGLSGPADDSILCGGANVDMKTGASGSQYFNTFYPFDNAAPEAILATCTFSSQRLNLPSFEEARCMAEIGNLLLVGCAGSVVYPWNQVDATPSGLINLPEGDVQRILTVNQMAYVFAGNQGNVYISDGGMASLVLNLPDYLAGVPGNPGSYIEATYRWGDVMYLRGRVYFSVSDQSASKAGNCGGIWSFYPSQNLYTGQDTGLAVRLEQRNSYGTFDGVDTVLLPAEVQDQQYPLYWSGWQASLTGTSYGIDYSAPGTSAAFPAIIETDAIPAGTMLDKRTLQQIEFKLGAPLDTGASVAAEYRLNLTDAWSACSPFEMDESGLSGYAPVNFEKVQWIQLRVTLTPITSTASADTFIRLREVRLR